MASTLSSLPRRALHPRVSSRRNLTLARWLSSALVVVSVAQAALGVLMPGIFRDPAVTIGNARGTDVVILAVAVPVLVIAMALAARGSLRAQIVWLGALCYMLYNAVFFAFDLSFNVLFLLYVGALSLALWSLVALLVRVDVQLIRDRFSQRAPVRAFATYLLVCTLLFIAQWLRDILPATFANTTPASLYGTKMLTNPIQVLDLSITLPASTLAAVWLWQRRPWGYVLSGMILTMLVIETASVASDQFFGNLHDPAQSLAAVPLFAALTLVGLAVTIAYLWYLRNEFDAAAKERV